MKALIQKIVHRFRIATRELMGIWGEASSDSKFPVGLLWVQAFSRKILGGNRQVARPVHWSSEVQALEKIIRGNRCPCLSLGCYFDGRNRIVVGDDHGVYS